LSGYVSYYVAAAGGVNLHGGGAYRADFRGLP
jgi:hypothetical protein